MKLYLYTNKKYNIKRFDTYDYYKIKANCLNKERGLIKMIVLSSSLRMKNQRQWMYRYVV